jgi:hypothetical protein
MAQMGLNEADGDRSRRGKLLLCRVAQDDVLAATVPSLRGHLPCAFASRYRLLSNASAHRAATEC